jgi:ABC-2 type transport system permease protein/lipopolysaccharide transport system permease protein
VRSPGLTALLDVARRDVLSAFKAWRLWTMLGWNDILQRYRRSTLGPFWITLSMGVFIALLGVIYSRIFRMEISSYLPYLTMGYVTWGFISQVVNESCSAFQESDRIIKQLRLPYGLYILRVVWRNFIVFLHTIVIFIPVAIVFRIWPGSTALLALPGLALLLGNLCWVALALAILAARFRDISQIVSMLVQILMFATPIMWPVSSIEDARWIADINPLYHLIELVRAPLLGADPAGVSWVVAIGMIIVGSSFALLLLARGRRRIVFWL